MEEQRASLKGRVRLLLATTCGGHNILIRVSICICICDRILIHIIVVISVSNFCAVEVFCTAVDHLYVAH